MPRMDGTGPQGRGAKTGRGMGICNESKEETTARGLGLGLGLRCRRGYGRGFGRGYGRGYRRDFSDNIISNRDQKDLLIEEKAILEDRLNLVKDELDSLDSDK
ncbi:DUF5320 domain-containing protein [Clostridium oceanicum]|uniref:DUF5320 domain-containing protein n=1 Tax=Clostridium oceanicum TaxID=1543 RepID=A0ABP3UQ59_9CLOT